MSVGILLIFESALVTAFGVVMQVVVIDVYPQIWGIHIAFYIFAGLLVAYGIIDMIRFQKRRKRRILRGQLKNIALNFKLESPLRKSDKKPIKSSIYGGQSANKRTKPRIKTKI